MFLTNFFLTGFSFNKIRIYAMTYFDEVKPYSGDVIRPVIGAGNGRLSARSIKIFGDGTFFIEFDNMPWIDSFIGALRTGGAAVNISAPWKSKVSGWRFKFQLYEPYADNPTTNGFMRLDPEVLFDVIPKYLRDGWQVVCSFLEMLPIWPDGVIIERSCGWWSCERSRIGCIWSLIEGC